VPIKAEFDFNWEGDEVESLLDEEYIETEFEGDEYDPEEASNPENLTKARFDEMNKESSKLQENSLQKETQIINSGKWDLDTIPPPDGKEGYRDNGQNIINLCVVQGKPVNVLIAPYLLDMFAAAKNDGITLTLSSAFRTPYESINARSKSGKQVSASSQDSLYKLYLAGRGNLAAEPGKSNHGWGIALDIQTGGSSKCFGVNCGQNRKNYQWLVENSWKYGFVRNVYNEEWHYDYKPDDAKNGPYGALAKKWKVNSPGTDFDSSTEQGRKNLNSWKFYTAWGMDQMTGPNWRIPDGKRV
jgi:hypothetical protein